MHYPKSTSPLALKPKLKTLHGKLILLLLLLILFVNTSKGQSNILFYHTKDFYNAPGYNPAFLKNQKEFTFNIFPMSGIGVSYNNREAIDNVVKILFTDEVDDESKVIFRSLVKKDLSYNYIDANLLNIGINTPSGAFNFQIKEKAYVLMRFGGEFSRFLMNTTGDETVGLYENQDFPSESVHLREYSFGYANELIRHKLDFGIRVKLYYGKSFMASTLGGQMIDQEGLYYAQSHGDVFFSIPATDNEENGVITKINVMNGKSISDYLFNRKNTGLGMDLGINWKINPQVEFTASVLDLGSITWKESVYDLNFDEGLYEIENIHFDPELGVLVKETDEVDLVDHIAELYDIIPTEQNYKTKIPTTFLLGLNYKLSNQLNIGIVNRYIQIENLGHNSFSTLVNYRYSSHSTLVSGIGVYGKSFENIPLGWLYQWRSAQFYIGTDNMLSFFVPKFSDYSSFNFGVDFNLFGPKVRYKKVKYLPFFKLKKNRRRGSDGLIFDGI
ncbi:DUF5723 family protein [Mangrovibacterium diazotrophicum]|uniref:DUF5723 domain-containing protein n=1 Tax=Mangrovibacterium diazotrophicum TaxID=1261403 RepID=A0A419WA88_9BACT|nr:DUF5723 family protein [Mangrovibacterium diazotrophicum]RKD92359.1 hypothetical protein BC643_2730 [Mangrovibacterium diazotrophicum]